MAKTPKPEKQKLVVASIDWLLGYCFFAFGLVSIPVWWGWFFIGLGIGLVFFGFIVFVKIFSDLFNWRNNDDKNNKNSGG